MLLALWVARVEPALLVMQLRCSRPLLRLRAPHAFLGTQLRAPMLRTFGLLSMPLSGSH